METRKPPDLIHSAAIHLLRRVAREDDAAGVGRAQLSALSVLCFAGPLTLGELASAERVRAPTMSRIVDALQREGLVRRERHAKDARAIRVVPTAKGRRLFERARSRRLAVLDELFADATREELATLQRAAAIVERALGK
jgi:DNA-binding MarR family transcriptional regulator